MTIQRYSEVYGVEGEQREDLFHHVQQMDAAYLKWQKSKSKKTETQQPEPSERPHRRAPNGK